MKPAHPHQQEDNDRVRITRWHLPPGSETGHHVHEYDYAVVPIEAGTLSIVEDDGSVVEAPLRAGESYFRRAGVSHNVTNRGSGDIVFVEIEIKGG
jgi:mannose-6-phosphate isomerase-like protein (cupin superfamily)